MFAARDRSTTRLHRRCAKRVGAADATAWSAVVAPQGRRQLRSTARSGRRAYSRREIASSAAFFVRAAEQQWPRLVHWGARPPFSPPANGRAFLAPRHTSRRGVFFAVGLLRGGRSARSVFSRIAQRNTLMSVSARALASARGLFLPLAPHVCQLGSGPSREHPRRPVCVPCRHRQSLQTRGQPRVTFPSPA